VTAKPKSPPTFRGRLSSREPAQRTLLTTRRVFGHTGRSGGGLGCGHAGVVNTLEYIQPYQRPTQFTPSRGMHLLTAGLNGWRRRLKRSASEIQRIALSTAPEFQAVAQCGRLSGRLLALRRGNEYDLPRTVTLLLNELRIPTNSTTPWPGSAELRVCRHARKKQKEQHLLGAEGGKRRLHILRAYERFTGQIAPNRPSRPQRGVSGTPQ